VAVCLNFLELSHHEIVKAYENYVLFAALSLIILKTMRLTKKKKPVDHQVQVLLSPHLFGKVLFHCILKEVTIQLWMKMHVDLCVKNVIGTK